MGIPGGKWGGGAGRKTLLFLPDLLSHANGLTPFKHNACKTTYSGFSHSLDFCWQTHINVNSIKMKAVLSFFVSKKLKPTEVCSVVIV